MIEQYKTWCNLGLLRSICCSPALCRNLATPGWLNLLLNLAQTYNGPNSLYQRVLAIRLLSSILPHRLDDLDDRQILLDRVFALIGNTLLSYANDPAIRAITNKKGEDVNIALTASHSSTVVEALVSLVRSLHVLPVWNSVINDAITDRLSLVPQLLSDLAQFQLQADDCQPGTLVGHATGVVASLAVVGGVDARPRLGGNVTLEDEIIGKYK